MRWPGGGGRRRAHVASEANAVRQRHTASLARARSIRRGHCGWNSKRRAAWRVKSAWRACDERARRARGERAASSRRAAALAAVSFWRESASAGCAWFEQRSLSATAESARLGGRDERARLAARHRDRESTTAERKRLCVERATRGGARPGLSAENSGSLRVTRSRYVQLSRATASAALSSSVSAEPTESAHPPPLQCPPHVVQPSALRRHRRAL